MYGVWGMQAYMHIVARHIHTHIHKNTHPHTQNTHTLHVHGSMHSAIPQVYISPTLPCLPRLLQHPQRISLQHRCLMYLLEHMQAPQHHAVSTWVVMGGVLYDVGGELCCEDVMYGGGVYGGATRGACGGGKK